MGILLILLVFLGLAAALALWAMGIYNGLVTSRNGWKNAFAQIDVQLKRRYDLIPNLVETVRAYAAHERNTLEGVTRLRNQAAALAQAGGGQAQAARALGVSRSDLSYKLRKHSLSSSGGN